MDRLYALLLSPSCILPFSYIMLILVYKIDTYKKRIAAGWQQSVFQ